MAALTKQVLLKMIEDIRNPAWADDSNGLIIVLSEALSNLEVPVASKVHAIFGFLCCACSHGSSSSVSASGPELWVPQVWSKVVEFLRSLEVDNRDKDRITIFEKTLSQHGAVMALQFESDKILANKHSRRGEVARRALREMFEIRRLEDKVDKVQDKVDYLQDTVSLCKDALRKHHTMLGNHRRELREHGAELQSLREDIKDIRRDRDRTPRCSTRRQPSGSPAMQPTSLGEPESEPRRRLSMSLSHEEPASEDVVMVAKWDCYGGCLNEGDTLAQPLSPISLSEQEDGACLNQFDKLETPVSPLSLSDSE